MEHQTDVIIVGSGLAGLRAMRQLSVAAERVCRGRPGRPHRLSGLKYRRQLSGISYQAPSVPPKNETNTARPCPRT